MTTTVTRFDLLDAPPGIRGATIRLSATVKCLCPMNSRHDTAQVEVTYSPTDKVIELESFAKFLATFENEKLLHEEFTARLAATLTNSSIKPSSIVTTWAPVEGVDCSIIL